MVRVKKISEPIALRWRNHTASGSFVRIWRTDWFGDQFEVMPRECIYQLERLLQPFGIPVTEVQDDED